MQLGVLCMPITHSVSQSVSASGRMWAWSAAHGQERAREQHADDKTETVANTNCKASDGAFEQQRIAPLPPYGPCAVDAIAAPHNANANLGPISSVDLRPLAPAMTVALTRFGRPGIAVPSGKLSIECRLRTTHKCQCCCWRVESRLCLSRLFSVCESMPHSGLT